MGYRQQGVRYQSRYAVGRVRVQYGRYRQQDVRYQSRWPKNEKCTFPYFLSFMKPGSELKE